ncbi:hypothetical protein PCLA_07f0388 [Pseudomonas citronellolis]|nr:hypothetical protein PCLA_07f0388 [Pseudomonas citronellolis]
MPHDCGNTEVEVHHQTLHRQPPPFSCLAFRRHRGATRSLWQRVEQGVCHCLSGSFPAAETHFISIG